jgi:hypothetical protein
MARAGRCSALVDQHREHPGVRLPGARMKLVGGNSGRVEHEELIDQVLLAPSVRRRRSTCGTSEREDINLCDADPGDLCTLDPRSS